MRSKIFLWDATQLHSLADGIDVAPIMSFHVCITQLRYCSLIMSAERTELATVEPHPAMSHAATILVTIVCSKWFHALHHL